jgi:hypothetical protein
MAKEEHPTDLPIVKTDRYGRPTLGEVVSNRYYSFELRADGVIILRPLSITVTSNAPVNGEKSGEST